MRLKIFSGKSFSIALAVTLIALLTATVTAQFTGPHGPPPHPISHSAVVRYRAAMHLVHAARQTLITIANRLSV